MGAPVRFQKAVPRTKENAAVERRKARRSALWAGSSLPLEGQVRSHDGPTGAAFRAREFRRSASLFLGLRRVRNRQFGTTVRRDAPRGNAPPRPKKMHREGMTMPEFAHLTLHRHARACRGHPRLALRQRRAWMAGTSPAMTNVGSLQVARLLRFARNDADGLVHAVIARSAQRDEAISATRADPTPQRNRRHRDV
jgi:hypothetical protein